MTMQSINVETLTPKQVIEFLEISKVVSKRIVLYHGINSTDTKLLKSLAISIKEFVGRLPDVTFW